MKDWLFKFVLVIGIFAAGYIVPSLLQFDKKMQFTQHEDNYERVDCKLVDNQCSVQDYKLEIVKGSFSTMEQTIFKLTKNNHEVSSDILITSDDKIFGTIVSQRNEDAPTHHKVLIPYCGNPVMQIIIIDSNTQKGLVIDNLTQRSDT
ncbi:hypothetical protein [Vibrio ziniensis]|uniref:Uncharacterized protein n=1 Tax=Vibrio ziniensis TaxID=2711221 RepID=A0A6G7CKV9_9VIBR|nr:hypothetical protein [Vibrio ziniensis]QIH42739.1 hypothetical protein G5S32_12420 [Vibrio ziniensis]